MACAGRAYAAADVGVEAGARCRDRSLPSLVEPGFTPPRCAGLQLGGCPLAQRHVVRFVVPLLAVFREPDTRMLQETDQVQTDQKLRGTPAGALTEPGGDLLAAIPAHDL
jgi:hypothetical protein